MILSKFLATVKLSAKMLSKEKKLNKKSSDMLSKELKAEELKLTTKKMNGK